MLRFPDCSGVHALPIDDSQGLGPPSTFGTIRVLHQVGSGVLGPVFRAHDPGQDRLVAVKALKLDIVPEDVTRLADALRALAAAPLHHPNIVPILSAGLEGGRAFVVMEYVTGESFDIALRHLAPSPLAPALQLLRELAAAIDAAWASGVGHGALHPRDVFVTPGELSARITGIGMVQALEQVGVKAPIRRPYTAPERSDGRPWDIRADVYSLGALAHELLDGRRLGALTAEADALPAIPAADRPRVLAVLQAALAADAEKRFPSASAFVEALSHGRVESTAPPVPVTAPPEVLRVRPDPPVVPVVDPAAERPIQRRPPNPAPVGESDRLRVRVRSTGSPAPVSPVVAAPAASYPWPAIIAVALAALTLGVAGGYAISREGPAPGQTAAGAPAIPPADTEVTVRPEPRPTPPEVQPAARVSSAPGRIVVRSVPAGALVTVDGRHAGETPTTVGGLTLGPHTLVIARPGYVPRSERVTLSAREVSKQLTVQLRPGVDVRGAQLGSLYVDSRPRGARVMLDGRFVGTTPVSVPELATGSHGVQLELEGYLPTTSTVTVRAGEQVRVALSLGRGDRE